MNKIYLTEYSVRGIKSLDQLVTLSFYKKTMSKHPDTDGYNIKGIYGKNGTGKSGIVSSIMILQNILTNNMYLNNIVIQQNLDSIINKKTNKLDIHATFFVDKKDGAIMMKYEVCIGKNEMNEYVIQYENVYLKEGVSSSATMKPMIQVQNGVIAYIDKASESPEINECREKSLNLLSKTSVCRIFVETMIRTANPNEIKNKLINSLFDLFDFATRLNFYLEDSDEHKIYLIRNMLDSEEYLNNPIIREHIMNSRLSRQQSLKASRNQVFKEHYNDFKLMVDSLFNFLHIFKQELREIEIDRKEDRFTYNCDLVMVYDDYKINAEYESTGIKKLIKLYTYLDTMVSGGIVFIDEFDSNLHDVYLCALLEYLMEYGHGQLCFTTHNVGPMDILRRNKNSIDFLSENHKIYPWIKNGNYSPSKLYRNGMIEGSPFNIESFDFISAFHNDEED